MTRHPRAIIVGGGFFGCSIAVHLAAQDWDVTLLEREDQLMTQASYVNQARLHNGYHYPRSFRTAIRSRVNLGAFQDTYEAAIREDFRPLYAVARVDSKINAQHFERFCKALGIPLKSARKSDRALFNPQLVQAVYEVEEPVFDSIILRDRLAAELSAHQVTSHLNTGVVGIEQNAQDDGELLVRTEKGDVLAADWVFSCTYAALNHVDGRTVTERPPLLHQISEIALVQPPEALAGLGVTIMDGPFFSMLPFPSKQQHSLTHVRYTHHMNWTEAGDKDLAEPLDPREVLSRYLESGNGPEGRSRATLMMRDAQRFLPVIAEANLVESLFSIKSLMTSTQIDDARPIYFHRDGAMPKFISILGGKIDNIFDVIKYIDTVLAQEEPGGSAGQFMSMETRQ